MGGKNASYVPLILSAKPYYHGATPQWDKLYIKLVDPLVAREAIPSSPMYLIAHILLHHQTIGAGKIRAPPALGAAA